MIDRGISEEYLVWWLENMACDAGRTQHIERGMRGARTVTRYGAGGRSLVQIYDHAYARFRSRQLAAEYLRRVLQELAEPTPVDDSLPPPDSHVWEYVYSSQRFLPYRAF